MRLIDSDEVKEHFSEILEHDYKDDYARGFQAALVAVLGYKAATPPPNAPLTLDDLREMDGEPVWVLQPSNLEKSKYALVYVENEWLIATKNSGWLFSEVEKGEVIVYRRKPEEGET